MAFEMVRRVFSRFGSSSLGARAVRASLVAFVRMGSLHVLRLVSNLIMTRLLLPEAFGLMAFVSAIFVGFTMLSDVGFRENIVREKDGDAPHFLQAAWVMRILRGLLLVVAFLLLALAVGVFGPSLFAEGTIYADPRLPWLLAIMAVAPLVQGFESTTKELQQRRLHFGRIALVEISAQVVVVFAMVGFALLSPTVWALLAGMLVGQVIKTIGSHWVYPGPRMELVWDTAIMWRLWHFGKWLIGSSAFTFVATNGDRFILGAYLSASSFGIYAIARIWFDAGQQVLNLLVGSVGFSAMGEILRERPTEVARLFRKYQIALDAMCLAAFCVAFLLGPSLIAFLYTSTYAEAGQKVQVLAFGLLVIRFNSFGSLVLNLGNSRAGMIIHGIRALTLCVSLPLAFDAFGLTGALFAVALAPLLSVPYALYLVRPVLGGQILIDAIWGLAILAGAGAWAVFGTSLLAG